MDNGRTCEQCAPYISSSSAIPMRPTILALDLEGTLISNAISQIPRPGLVRFLNDMQSQFDRLVMFTTVSD
jgi:trehalose-6-phosphatase